MRSHATIPRKRAIAHTSLSLLTGRGEANSVTLKAATVALIDPELVGPANGSQLARLLHPAAHPDRLTEAELADLVGEICAKAPIEGPGAPSLAGRRYARLFRTDTVEAWVIAWAPSAYLGLHDHGDSSGAFQVVAGHLREVSTDLVARPRLATRRLGPGTLRTLGPTHVHDLWNPTAAPALSVHVYSPPLRAMSFYSDQPATYLAKQRTETEAEWPDPDRWVEQAIG
jgi:Cysteine dioxygenase type I